MCCDEADTLLEKYKKAVKEYVATVMKYRDLAVGLPVAELTTLQRACDYAREKCEAAHQQLRQHRAAHKSVSGF